MIGEGNTGETSADFNMIHTCSVIRIDFVSPKSAVYTNVALKAANELFFQTAEMNLETQSINPVAKKSYANLALDDIAVEEGEKLVAYMIVAPVDLSGKDVKLVVTSDDEKEIEFDVKARELRAGKLYLFNTPEIEKKEVSTKHRASSLAEPSVSVVDIPIDTDSEIIVTGIQQTKYNQEQDDDIAYTLSGIRTKQSSAKGVIIKNGKKCLSPNPLP